MTIFALGIENDSNILRLLPNYGYGVLEYRSGEEQDEMVIALTGSGSNANTNNLKYLGELRKFEELVKQSQLYKTAPKIYLLRDITDSGTDWKQTPLKDMHIQVSENFYHYLKGWKPEVIVTFSHEPYWEDQNWFGILSGNPYREVYPYEALQGSDFRTNKFTWDYNENPSYLQSDLFYPVRIRIQPYYMGITVSKIFLLATTNGGPFFQEAEGMGGGSYLPSSPNYSLYTNGRYRSASLSGNFSEIFTMTFSPVFMGNDPYLIFARWLNPDYNARFGYRIKTGSNVLLEYTNVFRQPEEIIKLGVVEYPNILSKNPDTVTFSILGMNTTGSGTVNFDYIEFWPERDTIELISASGRPLGYNETLVVDGSTRKAWVENNAGLVIEPWVILGSGKLLLEPKKVALFAYKAISTNHINNLVRYYVQIKKRYAA